jgi:Flp pilus assembly protein TadD
VADVLRGIGYGSFKVYENLGAIYLRTNRLNAAIASLKTAIEIQPTEAKALNALGVAFMQSGRAAEVWML